MTLSSPILPFQGLNLPKSCHVWEFLVSKWALKVVEWQSGSTFLAAFCLLSLDYDVGNALSHSWGSFSARISLWGCASPWGIRAASIRWLRAMKPSQAPAEDERERERECAEDLRSLYPKLCLLRPVWSTGVATETWWQHPLGVFVTGLKTPLEHSHWCGK